MSAEMILEGMVYYRGTQVRTGWQRCGHAFLHVCYEGALAVLADHIGGVWRCPICGGHRVDVSCDDGEEVRITIKG